MSDDADNAEPAEDGPLKLERAAVAGVLGEYTHSFEFSDERDFVILYGPNGVGKTKFLETIHALMRLDAAKLLRLPFDRAELDFADGTRLSALKQLEQGPIDLSELPGKARVAIMFIIERKGVVKGSWPYAPGSFEEFLIESTSWANIGDDLWEDQDDGEVARLSDLESRYRTRVREGGNQSTRKQMPAPFSNLQSRLKSHLIETQRLRIENYIDASNPRRRPGSPTRSQTTIREHATTMMRLLQDALAESSKITQQLDRTFPSRILASDSPRPVSEDDVRLQYIEQNDFRSRLAPVAVVSLAPEIPLPDRALEDWEIRLLDLYLQDTDAKLRPFETLVQKIELLEKLINTRLLKKRVQATVTKGLEITSTTDGREISLDSLSSGEQHELILMFDLLFNVPQGGLVLIDEPEISLHVSWQLAFMPDVEEIAELSGFRFVVATHSPQIINDAWNSAVRLGPVEALFE